MPRLSTDYRFLLNDNSAESMKAYNAAKLVEVQQNPKLCPSCGEIKHEGDCEQLPF